MLLQNYLTDLTFPKYGMSEAKTLDELFICTETEKAVQSSRASPRPDGFMMMP